MRNNVTVDYGLRWDYDAVPFDPGNHQQTFSLATDTLAPGGTQLYHPNRTDFSPRLGVAWQVSNRLMIRTGYGIFYQAYPTGLGANIVTNNLPGNTSLTRAQIPSLSYPLAPYLSQGSLALPSGYGYDSNRHDTYAHQWNFTTEWALSRTTGLSVAYVGDHGLNPRRALNINYPNAVTKIPPIAGYSNVNIEYNNGGKAIAGCRRH